MKKKQSFEEMLDELNGMIARLSDDDTPLEEALKLYAQAAEKIAACSGVLEHAKVQIEEIGKTMEQQTEGGRDEEL